MTTLLATAHAALVRHGGPRHGLRFGLLIIVVIVVAVVVLIQRQRRRDRTTMEVASPTAATSDGHPAVVRLVEPVPPGHYHFSDLVRAEWTKLRTVRSTGWTLLITVVLGLGISAVATSETRSHWSSTPAFQHVGFDPTATSLIGIFVARPR